jgi:hypothetical protein
MDLIEEIPFTLLMQEYATTEDEDEEEEAIDHTCINFWPVWGVNHSASLSLCLLLTGLIIFPSTFPDPVHEHRKISIIRSLAGSFVLLGATGICWLWYKHRDDYTWLMDRLFLPGFSACFAGSVTMIMFTEFFLDGQWSKVATVTTMGTGLCMVVFIVLHRIYDVRS